MRASKTWNKWPRCILLLSKFTMMSVRGRVQDPLSAAAGSLNGSPGMGSLSSRLSVQLLLTRQRIPFQTRVELLIPSNRRLWVFQHEFFQQRWESLKGIVLASFVRGISVISYLMKMLGCINIDKIIWKLFFLILNKLSKNIIISFMDTCISYLFCCRSTSWKNNYFQPFLLMLFLCAKVASS